jgi:hypothetical protein
MFTQTRKNMSKCIKILHIITYFIDVSISKVFVEDEVVFNILHLWLLNEIGKSKPIYFFLKSS